MQPRKPSSIKSRVSLHDRSQVEVTFSYGLRGKNVGHANKLKDPAYQVDAYFFYPAQMRISPETYPKERFYHDMRAFVRLREPRLSYKELIGESEKGEQSPITFIRMYLKSILVGANWETVEVALDEARLFGCSYSSYMYRRADRRRRALERLARGMVRSSTGTDHELMRRTLTAIRKLVDRGFKLLRCWRELMELAATISEELDAGLRQELHYVNEYCSYAYRDSMVVLLQALDQLRDVCPSRDVIRLRRRLLAAMRLERWHSRKRGYFWVEAESSFEYQERYVSHRSALKRRIWSVLYLDARTKPLFAIQRQFGAMLSAGLAATWALFTAEILLRKRDDMASSGLGLFSTDVGLGGFLLISSFIMAYVLKDRIKELGRSYFTFKMFKNIPDNSNHISFGTAFGETRSIGMVKETASFENKNKLPKEIRELRERKSQELVDPEELYKSVLHYRKKIYLRQNALKDLPQPVKAVHDILRVSVSSYLARLDESLHRAVVLNDRNRAEEILMPKVYHLDILLKYSTLSDDKEMVEPIYDYVRLFINKEGLLRIKQLH